MLSREELMAIAKQLKDLEHANPMEYSLALAMARGEKSALFGDCDCRSELLARGFHDVDYDGIGNRTLVTLPLL